MFSAPLKSFLFFDFEFFGGQTFEDPKCSPPDRKKNKLTEVKAEQWRVWMKKLTSIINKITVTFRILQCDSCKKVSIK